ncbi:MAG: FHA domain-containing protein [Alphaproteobacteria bacterium]|nr:FHA domain-containing protein [Alphaproteobacteria bacterium]
MAHEELITEFNSLVDEYARHRAYIDKAQAQAEKFSKAVIEKVILDHEIKASDAADAVLPHVPKLQELIAGIDSEIAEINTKKAGSDEQMEELQLRAAIGELADGEFEEASKELREELEAANGRIETLDGDRQNLQGALDRWVELAGSAGQATGVQAAAATAEPEPEPAPEPEPEPEAIVEMPQVEEITPDGTHVEAGDGMREDVSAVFEDSPGQEAAAAVEADDGDDLIEVADIAESEGDEPSADVDFGFDDGDDFLADEGGAEVQLDLVAGVEEEPAEDDDVDIAVDLSDAEEPAAEPADDEAEDARRALLLYQEGTAEEQIYPFTGEVLTIGRGRDNDIQIKNDSKVSRFHCRLFRRGGNFYIEDNKSSNGTLVNGELITERRLFGGEEVIIGETFFRFRIM